MSVQSDLDKGTTLGDADGPDAFIPELGMIVPTFIDPRDDLIAPGIRSNIQRLSHHVPFRLRGEYKPNELPDDFLSGLEHELRIDHQGFVLCAGTTKHFKACMSRAQNRSGYCVNHGGGLHLADKKMSNQTLNRVPEERVEQLDRVQQFMQGFIAVNDLSDEEIQGQFVYDSNGLKVTAGRLGYKFQGMLSKELHTRLNRFLQSKTSSMLNVMVDIAESDLVEPADRIKAAIWVAERTMGKTPDVLIHGRTEAPYESIFETVESGSREAYRNKAIESHRILEAEVVELPTDDPRPSDGDGNNGSDSVDAQSEDERVSAGIDTGIPIDDPHAYAAAAIAQQAEAKALRARINVAKKKRFAARLGIGSLRNDAFGIAFEKIDGGYTARLLLPAAVAVKIGSTSS